MGASHGIDEKIPEAYKDLTHMSNAWHLAQGGAAQAVEVYQGVMYSDGATGNIKEFHCDHYRNR